MDQEKQNTDSSISSTDKKPAEEPKPVVKPPPLKIERFGKNLIEKSNPKK